MRPAQYRDIAVRRLEKSVAPVAGIARRAGILTVAASLVWYVQALLVAAIFAGLVEPEARFVSPWVAIGVFAFLGVMRAVINRAASGFSFAASDGVMALERHALLRREAMGSPLFERVSSPEIASLAAEKIKSIGHYVARYQPAMLRTRILPLVILALAFSMSWVVGIIFLITGPLIPIFMALVGLAARQASEQQMQEIGNLNSLLVERIRALTDIRLLDASAKTIASFEIRADTLRQETMAVLRIAFLSSTVLELFSAIGIALVAVYIGFALLGELNFGAYATRLTLFEGIFLLLLAPEFYQPMRDIAAAWHDRAAALAVASELAELEDDKRYVPIVGKGAYEMSPHFGNIQTVGLAYETPGGNRIAYGDLSIAQGEKVALVGPSGSGKSTLLALLAGFADPSHGQILIDGVELTAGNADAWRGNVAWIAQSPHFLNASLKANLLLDRHSANDADVPAALDAAAARSVVDRLPQGVLTRLGEAGHGVSGGEARRLMIARAIASGKPIILADEPTADLDEETAESIMQALLALAQGGATLVVATHDPKVARQLDRVIPIGGDA